MVFCCCTRTCPIVVVSYLRNLLGRFVTRPLRVTFVSLSTSSSLLEVLLRRLFLIGRLNLTDRDVGALPGPNVVSRSPVDRSRFLRWWRGSSAGLFGVEPTELDDVSKW